MLLEEGGHSVHILKEEELEEYTKYSKCFANGAVKIYPENLLVSPAYTSLADELCNFKFRETDVVTAGYPKSGTTWLQEIVWQMLNNPNGDNSDDELDIIIRNPYFEFDHIEGSGELVWKNKDFEKHMKSYCPGIPYGKDFKWLNLIEELPGKRVMKSHLPPTLLNDCLLDTAKVIHIIRDPKDVCLSRYYFEKAMKMYRFQGTLEDFAISFLDGNILWGKIDNHIRLWMPHKNHKNVHVLFYEDLKLNNLQELKKLDAFLGTQLTITQLETVKKRTSFEEMKKRKSVFDFGSESLYRKEETEERGGFFRKGIVGEAKEKLSSEMQKMFRDRLMKSFDEMNLPYMF